MGKKTDSTNNSAVLQPPVASTGVGAVPLLEVRSAMLREVTLNCLAGMTDEELSDPGYVEQCIIDATTTRCQIHNQAEGKDLAWPIPRQLEPVQIADIMMARYTIRRIPTGGMSQDDDYDLIGIFQEEGPMKGLYDTSEMSIRKIARQYCYTLSKKEFEEVLLALKDKVDRREPSHDKDLIAVNNGLFNFRTKELLDFSPEHVFLSKSGTDYRPNAPLPIIHNDGDGTDWDVESWMSSLSDDPQVVNLLWQILGAIVRPNVSWNQSAWFVSEEGNNGKGTLCTLMRELCGQGNHTSIPLADMNKDFALEPIVHCNAIIVDENDVGVYIDKASNLKALITHDVVQVNRKFKFAISVRYYGFIVQCLNKLPRFKDNTDSFFRRQIYIPFDKCFTGVERKYIKDDYMHRKEVLEYVLCKVLNMNNYKLDVPLTCLQALDEFRDYNDPVREFVKEVVSDFKWDLVPAQFLFELFTAWYRENHPSGAPMSKIVFNREFKKNLAGSTDWVYSETQVSVGNKMNEPEPLIWEYKLTDWMNKDYINTDRLKACVPKHLMQRYRGLVRNSARPSTPGDPDTASVSDFSDTISD